MKATQGGQESEGRCPKCRFHQTETCAITDEGVTYVCRNDACRVSEFYGEERWPEAENNPNRTQVEQ